MNRGSHHFFSHMINEYAMGHRSGHIIYQINMCGNCRIVALLKVGLGINDG